VDRQLKVVQHVKPTSYSIEGAIKLAQYLAMLQNVLSRLWKNGFDICRHIMVIEGRKPASKRVSWVRQGLYGVKKYQREGWGMT